MVKKTNNRNNKKPIKTKSNENKTTDRSDGAVNKNDSGKGDQKNADLPENQASLQATKKYQKRKIVSNWDRYDDVDDDNLESELEYDETKDFEKIRHNTASASSHFEFKDEEEWGSRSSTNGDGNIFSLDISELAESLRSFTMEEKLNITSLIPEDCKYCITSLPSRPVPQKSSLFNVDQKEPEGNFKWSYEGLQKYKHLFSQNNCVKVRVQDKDTKHDDDKDEPFDQALLEKKDKDASSKFIDQSKEADDTLEFLNNSKGAPKDASYKNCEESTHSSIGNPSSNAKCVLTVDEMNKEELDEIDLDLLLLQDDIESELIDGDIQFEDDHASQSIDEWLDEMLN